MMELSTSDTTMTVAIAGGLDRLERRQFPGLAARISGLHRFLLVFDLCHTTTIDSTGAAFLISVANAHKRRGGATVLRGSHPGVQLILESSGTIELFRIDAEHRCPDFNDARLHDMDRQILSTGR